MVIIHDCCTFDQGSVLWIEDNGCEIETGKFSTFGSVHFAATENGNSIVIGDDCMFSDDVDIRTGDSHSIIDNLTGQRMNYATDVIIGNHVWCGAHTSILKGSIIPSNVIIGTRSVVTKSISSIDIENGVIISGMPAKIIKKNVHWIRERI